MLILHTGNFARLPYLRLIGKNLACKMAGDVGLTDAYSLATVVSVSTP